jgi:hypothetical protein
VRARRASSRGETEGEVVVAGEVEDGVDVRQVCADDEGRGGEAGGVAQAGRGERRADEGVGERVHRARDGSRREGRASCAISAPHPSPLPTPQPPHARGEGTEV